MTKFDGAYPFDFLYIKVKDKPGVLSLPLCEVIEGKLVKEKTTKDAVVFVTTELNDDGKTINKELSASPDEFYQLMSTALNKESIKVSERFTMTFKIGEIESLVIQPEGEPMTPELFHFLEKYGL